MLILVALPYIFSNYFLKILFQKAGHNLVKYPAIILLYIFNIYLEATILKGSPNGYEIKID